MTGVVDSVDVSVEVWGGLVTDISPSDLPHGTSPDAQDCQFQIGGVRTRPGVTAAYSIPNVTAINYMKTFENVNEIPRFLTLDSSGALWKDSIPGGALSAISSGIIPGAFCRSDSLFEKEYFAFGDGQHGLDMPRQYDDTNFDRVSQVGPGAAPTVVDSGTAGNISAGAHQLTVIFVTRSGFYTKPAPPVTWTAAGSKQAAITNIPIGPPNVIARVLSFTAANQASFRHLGPLGLTLANSNMYIADNTTTSITVDFSDAVLLLGTNDDPLFLQIELPPVAGCIGYSNRLFAWGEQANVQNFINLTFDGGFGAAGISPTLSSTGPKSPSAAVNAPPKLVQSTGGQANGTFPLVLTLPSVAAGDTLVVGANAFLPPNFDAMTIADNKGNVWKPIVSHIRPSYLIMGWYASNVAAGTTSITITAPNANSSSFIRGGVEQIRGLDPSPIDGAAASGDNLAGGSGPWSPGVVNVSQQNDMIVSFVHNDTTLTMPAGYSAGGGFGSLQSAVQVEAAAGAYSATWTVVGNSAIGFTVALKATAPAWVNPNNALAADGLYATCNLTAPKGGGTLYVSGYDFSSIPSNATITGIVTKVLCNSSTSTAHDFVARMVKTGNPVTTPGSSLQNGNLWAAVAANQTYGGPNNLCGAAWTVADIKNPATGFAISAFSPSGTSLAGIDYISMEVYYTTPSSGVTVAPLGWTRGATYAGGSSALTAGLTAVFGDAFAITGDGVSPVVGLITQSAATDYLSNPVLLPGTAYGVRARVALAGGLVAGTVHVNLQSTSGAFTSPGLSVQAGQLTANYQAFTGTLTSALGIIPADLVLQVYADGTPSAGGVFLVDNIEIYPLNPQFNGSIVRASKGQLDTQGQESYDSETGLIEYNLNDGQSVRTCFKIRERLYIVKEHSFGGTQDDGANEPSSWTVGDVSKTVGTPSVNGVGIGEDWAVIAHRTGLYLYWGGEPVKISQEIQPTWDSINWQYGYTIAVTVDTKKRRILICAPFGTSTIPNKTLVLDYHDVGSDAAAIAANPPIHLTYTGNKKAFDRARKWCPWTIPANSIAQIELSNGQTGIYFGSNDGTGSINALDDTETVFTDNGATIPSYYFTAAFAELPTEEAKQLRSHRHLYSYLTFYAQGSGQLGITAYPNSLSNATALNPQALAATSFQDTEMMLNISAERVFFKFSSSGNGQFFDVQRACVSIRPEPWSIVRGAS